MKGRSFVRRIAFDTSVFGGRISKLGDTRVSSYTRVRVPWLPSRSVFI